MVKEKSSKRCLTKITLLSGIDSYILKGRDLTEDLDVLPPLLLCPLLLVVSVFSFKLIPINKQTILLKVYSACIVDKVLYSCPSCHVCSFRVISCPVLVLQ